MNGKMKWPRNGVVVKGDPAALERYAPVLEELASLRLLPLGAGWASGQALATPEGPDPLRDARTLAGATVLRVDAEASPDALARSIVASLIENEFQVLRFRFRTGRHSDLVRVLADRPPPRSRYAWSRGVDVSPRHLSRLFFEVCQDYTPAAAIRTSRAFRACQRRLESGQTWCQIAEDMHVSEASLRSSIQVCTERTPTALTLPELSTRIAVLQGLVLGTQPREDAQGGGGI